MFARKCTRARTCSRSGDEASIFSKRPIHVGAFGTHSRASHLRRHRRPLRIGRRQLPRQRINAPEQGSQGIGLLANMIARQANTGFGVVTACQRGQTFLGVSQRATRGPDLCVGMGLTLRHGAFRSNRGRRN